MPEDCNGNSDEPVRLSQVKYLTGVSTSYCLVLNHATGTTLP